MYAGVHKLLFMTQNNFLQMSSNNICCGIIIRVNCIISQKLQIKKTQFEKLTS